MLIIKEIKTIFMLQYPKAPTLNMAKKIKALAKDNKTYNSNSKNDFVSRI